ncbi:MAG: hypothetical protein ACJAQ3_002436 [Planctomycetota bacterium]|jgi:hypothetical protein
MSSSNGWRTVSREDLCPLCEHSDWCSVSDDGAAVVCGRTENSPQGWRYLKDAKDGRAIFQRGVDCPTAPGSGLSGAIPKARSERSAQPGPPSRDWKVAAGRFSAACPSEALEALGQSLGVKPSALRAINVGWTDVLDLRDLWAGGGDGWTIKHGAYSFPESDGRGRVVGLSLRTPDGAKGSPAGAGRGLVVPCDLDDRPGPVLIVEGASDVATCLTLGLPAVGRPSNSAGAKDLAKLLRGREVLVVGENDEKPDGRWPGRDGAVSVAEQLADSWGRTVLWTLPSSGTKDVRAWLANAMAEGLELTDTDACRKKGRLLFKELFDAAAPSGPSEGEVSPVWTPYPWDVLPKSIRDLAVEGAEAMGCDPSMIAVPALVCCAGAIGLSREVALKETWREPCVLWGAVVARSGAGKDPALDLAASPLREIDQVARHEQDLAVSEYEKSMECYSRDMTRWKRSKNDEDPPVKPQPPARGRLVVQDATYEALTRIVAENPRASVISVRGELSAWILEWGEYGSAGRGSSHASKWLELYGARFPAVDRVVTGEVFVPKAAVSVVGMIQPGTLRKRLGGGEHIDSGCVARLLWAMPPFLTSPYSEEEVSARTMAVYAGVIERLHALERDSLVIEGGGTDLQSVTLRLSPRARLYFEGWYNELACQMRQMPESTGASASKLEGGAARIALVIALVIAAEEGRENELVTVDEASMKAGVEIARWHLAESRRILAFLGSGELQSDEDPSRRELVDWVKDHPGSTAREVARNLARFKGKGGTERAKAALEKLTSTGGPLVRDAGRKTARYRGRTVDDDEAADGTPPGTPASAESVGVGDVTDLTSDRGAPIQGDGIADPPVDGTSVDDGDPPMLDDFTSPDWSDPG